VSDDLHVVEPSMKVDNLRGARFGGAVSPASLLANALHRAQDTDIVVVVQLDKDGKFHVGWTKGNGFKLMGIMYVALREVERSLEEGSA
jgi:hypothetical protein